MFGMCESLTGGVVHRSDVWFSWDRLERRISSSFPLSIWDSNFWYAHCLECHHKSHRHELARSGRQADRLLDYAIHDSDTNCWFRHYFCRICILDQDVVQMMLEMANVVQMLQEGVIGSWGTAEQIVFLRNCRSPVISRTKWVKDISLIIKYLQIGPR